MKNRHKQISLIALLCGALLVGCGQQEKPDMTVDQAFDYSADPGNYCHSNILQWRSKYCDYAGNLYDDANNRIKNKVLQDPIIQRLLTKAQGVDCYHTYPEPGVCLAVDMRANEIVIKVVRELSISATKPIFDTGSAFIQGKFNQQLQEQQNNQEANKLLREASESKNI